MNPKNRLGVAAALALAAFAAGCGPTNAPANPDATPPPRPCPEAEPDCGPAGL